MTLEFHQIVVSLDIKSFKASSEHTFKTLFEEKKKGKNKIQNTCFYEEMEKLYWVFSNMDMTTSFLCFANIKGFRSTLENSEM